MTGARSFAQLRKEHSFPKQALTVNSLGEVLRISEQNQDGMSLDSLDYLTSSINIAALARELGREPTEADFDAAFDAELKQFTTPDEFSFVKRVWKLQKENEGRFRFWGYIGVDGTRYIWLVTEFRSLVIDKPFWRELIDLSRRLSGGVRNICKTPQCDHRMENYGQPNQIDHYGPDHGKMERQVELYWNVTDWSDSQIHTQREEFAVRTQKLWDTFGIGVI